MKAKLGRYCFCKAMYFVLLSGRRNESDQLNKREPSGTTGDQSLDGYIVPETT